MNSVSVRPTKPVYRVRAGDALGASARPVTASVVGGGRTSYVSADLDVPSLAGWNPPLLSADAEWLWERDTSVARIRDLERNEGWVSAAIDRKVDMLVGGTFRLNSKPDAAALGISEDDAHELGRQIQAAWRGWAEDPTFRCDAERQLPFVGLMGLIAREFATLDESLAVLRWDPKPGFAYATAVHVVDPDRLSNPHFRMDDETFRGGVERDTSGAPIAYHIRKAHPGDLYMPSTAAWIWERFPRWDVVGDWQRPKVLHVYDKRRAGQSRGISRLVGGLTKIRMLSRYSEAEVRTAAINATIVGAIYTQIGPEYAAEVLGGASGGGTDWDAYNRARDDFYRQNRVVRMEDSRFLSMFPTDKLDLNTQARETAGLPAFQTAFLQAFAATLGVSYEQLSMDWSRTNYSSARAALNEVWRGIQRLRAILVWGAATPIFAAWLEEAIDIGEVVAPSGAREFYEAPAAWCRAEWIGPGRGYIDPVKEAQAAVLRRDGRISTLEREAAEQGLDWEMVLDQLQREKAEMERLGLQAPVTDLSITPASDRESESGNRREQA